MPECLLCQDLLGKHILTLPPSRTAATARRRTLPAERADSSGPLEADGGAAHGTGLRMVAQIAAAHGGKLEFHGGTPYRCELCLPVKESGRHFF